jgi:PAS domain S-box-containing protein
VSTTFGLRREFIVIALAVLAFVVLLSFAMTRLVTIERDTHSSSGEGIIWALSQTQYEIQRLLLATTPDRHATADEIGLRFDILLSRLNLLQDGPLARRIADAGRGNVAARAIEDLLELEPLIASSGNRVERYSARLSRTLLQYVEPLGSIANELMIQNRILDGQRRYSYNASIVQVIVSILGIMATGAFLILRLVRSLGKSAAAEAQVRRERNFLDLLLESSGEGIAAFDSQLICTHWNEGMARLVGLSAACCLGRAIGDADAAITVTDLGKVLGGQKLYLPPQREGDGRHLERVLNPIWLNGAVTGGILIVRDVTERYEAQRERQLREMYRDFVTMVSHQFRTPLAIIDSTMQRIVRRGSRMDEAELGDRARTIRVTVAGLSRLIDSTLATERVDAGVFDLTLRPVDMAQLMREVTERFIELSPERRIDLKLAHIEPLVCDSLLIDQALANLVGNAVKYSPKDKPVEVGLAEHEAEIVITVTDQGVGIPTHEQQQIFERFFRASTASDAPGTGVGLYAARQIATLHGGTIAVVSTPGIGSTFTLRLPRPPLSGDTT